MNVALERSNHSIPYMSYHSIPYILACEFKANLQNEICHHIKPYPANAVLRTFALSWQGNFLRQSKTSFKKRCD